MAMSLGLCSTFLPRETVSFGNSSSPSSLRFAPANIRLLRSVSISAAAKPTTETKKREPWGMMKPRRVSPDMQAFLGGATEIPRTQVLKEIWAYIKQHNLQVVFIIKRDMLLTATLSSPITSPCLVRSQDQCLKQTNDVQTSFRVKPLCFHFHLPERKRITTHSSRVERASMICAAALNATCSAESQTQTVTRQSSTITVAPIQGKEKSPDLDDGGAGFPPRDDDGDGGGGGGGGGGHWSGGFFFFGFLAFLGFLKDQESEGPYRDKRRR